MASAHKRFWICNAGVSYSWYEGRHDPNGHWKGLATVVRSPHFSLPFRFARGGCPVVEQDSSEEITQCGEVALRYERGQRTAIPDFGVPDQAMLQQGANLDQIVAA